MLVEVLVQPFLSALLIVTLLGGGGYLLLNWVISGKWEFAPQDKQGLHNQHDYVEREVKELRSGVDQANRVLHKLSPDLAYTEESVNTTHAAQKKLAGLYAKVLSRAAWLDKTANELVHLEERIARAWCDEGGEETASWLVQSYLRAYRERRGAELTAAEAEVQGLRRACMGVRQALRQAGELAPPVPSVALTGQAGGGTPASSDEFLGAVSAHKRTAAVMRERLQQLGQAQTEMVEWMRNEAVPMIEQLLHDSGHTEHVGDTSPYAGLATVQVLHPQRGAESDGRYHEEIAAPTDDCPPGHVIRTVERGYIWRGIVLRKAKVVVAAQTPQRRENSQEA